MEKTINYIKKLEKQARIILTDEERKKIIPYLLRFQENYKNLNLDFNFEEMESIFYPFDVINDHNLREDDQIENNNILFKENVSKLEDNLVVLDKEKNSNEFQ